MYGYLFYIYSSSKTLCSLSRRYIQFVQFVRMNHIFKNLTTFTLKVHASSSFHTTTPALAWTKSTLPKRFLEYNKKTFPPQGIGEEPRPAVNTICYIFFTHTIHQNFVLNNISTYLYKHNCVPRCSAKLEPVLKNSEAVFITLHYVFFPLHQWHTL